MDKLSFCREGDKVKIIKMDAKGAIKTRLMEMGFLRNEEVNIVKYAPFKDPIELMVKNNRVSLRVEEADNILVEVLS